MIIMPDFTRWIWLSADARAVWEMRISAIARAWDQVERASVAAGVRDSIMVFPEVTNLVQAFRESADRGLLLLPLSLEGTTAEYASSSTPYRGHGGKFRCAITRPELAAQWLQAYAGSDEIAIGKLLGYPSCCTEFYRRVWVQEGHVDTTLAMAERGAAGPPESNILLRWLTVRLVPHLPCSFNCERTVEFARSMYWLWEKMNFQQELKWAQEMLSWPIEYSALHGVAEIRTPILTISTRTDWTPDEQVVVREGSQYPEEGASGLRFPYRVVKDKATGVPSFTRSMTPVHELNGFGSAQAMEAAHATLLKMLPREPGRVLDLGCGSGRLLEWAKARGWEVTGIESDNVRAGAATVPVRRGDMFDLDLWEFDKMWDVVYLMPGRLLEGISAEAAERFRQALKARAGAVVMYAYGDWLTKYGSLQGLVAEAGFASGDLVNITVGDGVAAGLLPTPAHIGALE